MTRRVLEGMGDPSPHLAFRVHHARRADPLEDRAMERRPGLRDDVADAEVLERHRGEDARLGLAADRDDRVIEVARRRAP